MIFSLYTSVYVLRRMNIYNRYQHHSLYDQTSINVLEVIFTEATFTEMPHACTAQVIIIFNVHRQRKMNLYNMFFCLSILYLMTDLQLISVIKKILHLYYLNDWRCYLLNVLENLETVASWPVRKKKCICSTKR